MPHNENSRVKIPALVHFTRLGYKYISLRKYEGVIDDDTNILVDVLCDAINRINATSLTTTDTRPDGFATMIMDELNQDKVKQLKDACHRMMVEGDFVKYENVYHGVLTECSSQSTGIQLADYAVGIMNCYLRKHLMSRGDYTFATDLYTEFDCLI